MKTFVKAQIGSAVRYGFQDNAGVPPSPNVTSAACEVLAEFLCTNVRYGESGVAKLLRLIEDLLEKIGEERYPMFSSKANTLLQLSVLTTFARLYTIDSINKESVFRCLSPLLPKLRKHWMEMLTDYVVISIADKNAQKNYVGHFYEQPSFLPQISPFFDSRWEKVYLACCSLLSHKHSLAGREGEGNEERREEGEERRGKEEEKRREEEDFFILFGIGLRVLSKIHGSNVEASALSLARLLENPTHLRLLFQKVFFLLFSK